SLGGYGCGSGGSARSEMWLAYECPSAAGRGLQSRVIAPQPYAPPLPPPPPTTSAAAAASPFAHSLRFDSAFEGGNLLRAVQRGAAEYDLFLRPDLHTHGHTQWFHFAVTDTHAPLGNRGCGGNEVEPEEPAVVWFTVVNLTKPDSLFTAGMRPLLYSEAEAAAGGVGWRRCGENISYRPNAGSTAAFYTLQFSVAFPRRGDRYRLALAYPYTYSDHKRVLAALLACERASRHLTAEVLCRTLAGHDCDLLTVTDGCGGSSSGGSGSSGGNGGISGALLGLSGGVAAAAGMGSIAAKTAALATTGAATTTTAISSRCGDNTSGGGGGDGGRSGSGSPSAGSSASAAVAAADASYGVAPAKRRCIVISARVHPGETPASWMMEGMLKFLTGDSPEAALLRSMFVFKV
ncbi:unnamed protein product, partial [Phaeothamnion confervicola]